MIILRRSTLIILALLFSAMSLGMGIYGYQTMALHARISAEQLLFLGIVAALTILIVMLAVVRSAVSLDKRLDRLIEQGRNRDIVPGRDFSALGPLGSKLTILFNQLSELNYKKARKISALASLCEFLIRNQSLPIAVTDVTGSVRYVSDIFLSGRELNRADVLDENIEEFVPNLVVPSLVMNISRQKEAMDMNDGKSDSYVCYPLTDKSDELAYLVFMFGTKANYFDVRKSAQVLSKKSSNALFARLNRLINKNRTN